MAFALRRRPAAQRRDAVAADDPAVPGDGTAARPRPARTRVAAARGAWAVGSVMVLIARVVRLIVVVIVALIVAAIVLRVLDANAGNSIVKAIHDAAKFFVSPFDGMFSISKAKLNIAVNWGIGAIVYAVVGGIVASLIARAAPRGVAPSEPVV
jgi:hypothetical protein